MPRKKREYRTEVRDGKTYRIEVLPSDWQLEPGATKSRTLFQAADLYAKKQEQERKRGEMWKRRRRKT